MRQLALGTAVGLGLLCACADLGSEKPEHGDGVDGGPGADEMDCEDGKIETPWDLDEAIPEDLVTPRDLIDLATGLRRGVLTWQGSKAGAEVDASPGETDVTFELRYTGGDVVLHEGCSRSGLTIDLELGLSTTDGAFAETFEVTGWAWNEGIRVSMLVDPEELEGTFSAMPTDPDASPRLLLEAYSRAGHTTGRILVLGNDAAAPHDAATFIATPPEG